MHSLSIWNTHLVTSLQKDKITIENLQRRGTRLVKSLKHLLYEERLKTLGLSTLEYRYWCERANIV